MLLFNWHRIRICIVKSETEETLECSSFLQNCQHDTIGIHCEQCAEGYHGDATYGTPDDCLICACPLPIASNK